MGEMKTANPGKGARARAFQVAQHGAAVVQAAVDRAQLLLDPLEEGAVVLRAVQLPPHVLRAPGQQGGIASASVHDQTLACIGP